MKLKKTYETIHEFTRSNTKRNPHEIGFVLVCEFVDRIDRLQQLQRW